MHTRHLCRHLQKVTGPGVYPHLLSTRLLSLTVFRRTLILAAGAHEANDMCASPDIRPRKPEPSEGLHILSVTDLTRCVRAVLEAEDLFSDLWVRGEISNLTKHSSGHTYFCLKDEGALIRCVVWRSSAHCIRFDLADGMGVVLHGRLSVYEKQGQYQLVADQVMHDGVGTLYQAYENLKAKLQSEGLFDAARKKPIPPFPRRIAVITSPTAAALRDMMTIAARRLPCVNILLVPTLMQGDGSEASVVESLQVADGLPGVDVIVVGRGGGSIEDLWTFNTESVVRAIAACEKPVVSAIGHETDYTLADFAADLRAPTPSAAMELIIPDGQEVLGRIEALVNSAISSLTGRLTRERGRVENVLRSRCFAHWESMVQERWQTTDALSLRLRNGMERVLGRCEARLGAALARLEALSPLQVLSRGYAVVRKEKDRSVVRSISEVTAGERTETLLSDGRLISEIHSTLEGWD